MNKLRMSAHAWKRLSQRNITLSDLLIVIDRGQRIYRAHACFYFLGLRNLPPGVDREMERLVGTTVVVENNEIVTAYRNKHAASKIKRKRKRYCGKAFTQRRAISSSVRIAAARA